MAASFALCSIFRSLCGPPQSTFDFCPETVAKQCPPKTYCAYSGGTYQCLCTKPGLIYCPDKQSCDLTCGGPPPPPACCLDHLQIDPSLRNGIYTIVTPSGDVETFCDMDAGGWTLIGQTGQSIYSDDPDMYDTWLRSNVKVENLLTPEIESQEYSCLDAIDMAVNHATLIRLSNDLEKKAMGPNWVEWPMPDRRDVDTWWNHAIGQSAVAQTKKKLVTVTDNNGSTQQCYQLIQGMGCKDGSTGGYPATEVYDACGGGPTAASGDLCMMVPVIYSTNTYFDGWYNDGDAYDCPSFSLDWPNYSRSDQTSKVSVWLK